MAADPARADAGGIPAGWPGVAYFRLHGSPVLYRSSYEAAFLSALAKRMKALAAQAGQVWCIFDNPMLGAAAANALDLQQALAGARR